MEDNKKKIAFYIHASFIVENGEKALEKLHRIFETFEENKDNIQIYYCTHDQLENATKAIYPELWTKYLEFFDQYKNCKWIEIIDGLEKQDEILPQMDAYYGDGGYLSLKISDNKKPVMIMSVDV